MATQTAVTEEFGRNSSRKLLVHETEILNAEARLACDLIMRWGLVVGKIDGEDSTGRAILKECPPEEVVDKACDTAALALQAFRYRGWTLAGPDISELLRKTDD